MCGCIRDPVWAVSADVAAAAGDETAVAEVDVEAHSASDSPAATRKKSLQPCLFNGTLVTRCQQSGNGHSCGVTEIYPLAQ